jgi:hypothetical protein
LITLVTNRVLQGNLLRQVPLFIMIEDKNIELVNSVRRDFDRAKRRREPYEEVWNRCYKLYNSYIPPLEDGDWHSNLFISKCFSMVETELPRIVMATIASRDFFDVLPLSEEENERAKLVKKLITFQLNDEINIFLKLVDYIKQLIIYGNSPGKLYWEREKEMRQVDARDYIQEISKNWFSFSRLASFMGSKINKEFTIYDGPQFDFVDLYDFYPALPTIPYLDKQPYIIHRSYRDLDYLKDIQKAAGYDSEVIAYLEEKESAEPGWAKDERSGGYAEDPSMKRLSEIGISVGDGETGRYEIVERWKRGKVATTVYDHNLFLREVDYPYEYIKYPFIFSKHTPVPGEFYGKGLIEPNADAQFLLNEVFNTTMDNIKQLINKIITWKRGTDVDVENLISGPVGVITVDDHDDLRELPVTSVNPNGFQSQSVISQIMQETSGIWPYSQGQAPQRKETASGIISLQQAAEIRIQLITLLFQDSGIKELVKKIHGLNKQFLPDKKKIRILGREGLEFIEIKKQDVMIDCDFVPVGHPTMGNQELDFQKKLMVAQYIVGRGNQYEVDRMVLEAAKIPNPEDIIGPSPKDRMDPMQENQILATGEFINAHQYDPHPDHIPVHTQLLQSPDLNPNFIPIVANHLRQHNIFYNFQMQQRQSQMSALSSLTGGALGGIPTPAGEGEITRPIGQAEMGQRATPPEEMLRRNM